MNSSNSKWIAIGVKPNGLSSFIVDVILGGDKLSGLSIGASGVVNLFKKIRDIEYFKHLFLEVCIYTFIFEFESIFFINFSSHS